jgi:hypothetical protein
LTLPFDVNSTSGASLSTILSQLVDTTFLQCTARASSANDRSQSDSHKPFEAAIFVLFFVFSSVSHVSLNLYTLAFSFCTEFFFRDHFCITSVAPFLCLHVSFVCQLSVIALSLSLSLSLCYDFFTLIVVVVAQPLPSASSVQNILMKRNKVAFLIQTKPKRDGRITAPISPIVDVHGSSSTPN